MAGVKGGDTLVSDEEHAEGAPPAKVAGKGLIERLSGTSLRRNRLPTYMKPRFWPVYLGGLWVLSHAGDLVDVSNGVGIVLGLALVSLIYLFGLFVPMRMLWKGFKLVAKPVRALFSSVRARRFMSRQGLESVRLPWGGTRWVGPVGDVDVRVHADEHGTLIEARFETPVIPETDGMCRDDFVLEDRLQAMPETWRRTGDSTFENMVQIVSGRDSIWLPALLADVKRRRAVAQFLVHDARQLRYRCEVEGGVVRARLPQLYEGDALTKTYDAVVRTASSLHLRGVLPDLLARGAMEATGAAAQNWCLGVLLRRFHDAPIAADLASQAATHPDEWVRLWSAVLTRQRGDRLIGGLQQMNGDADTLARSQTVVDRALTVALGTEEDHDPAFLEALLAALDVGQVQVALLNRMAHTPWGLDVIAKRAVSKTAPAQGLVFQLLCKHAKPRFEGVFIAGLAGPHHIQLACIAGLRKVGSLRAVAPLIPLRDKRFGHSEVRALASETIADIQGRAPAAGRGQLSLVEHRERAGGVSLATASEGG